MKFAALYARESPSLAENEQTIASQVEAIEQRITEDGNELVERYEDNGYSGELLQRPALDRLRDDAALGKFKMLYIFDRDRLARVHWKTELILEELEELGIEIIFLLEKPVETPEDKILLSMRGLFAQYEREKIKERTRRGRMHRARKGLLVGNEPPYGYQYVRPDKDKEERWYEIVEEEAQVVRKIFRWLAYDQLSMRQIIVRLHSEGIKPKGNKDIWASSTLARLVRREDYIGTAYYNKSASSAPLKHVNSTVYKRFKKTSRKIKPRGEWLAISIPPIIDKETFDLAQKQIRRNQEFASRNRKRDYALSGLITCAKCQSRFAGEATRGTRYYRSTLRLRKFPLKQQCICTSVNALLVENLVWKEITKLLTNPILVGRQYARFTKSIRQEVVTSQNEIDKELESLRVAEKRLVDAFTKGVFTEDQIKGKLAELKSRRLEVEQQKRNSPPLPNPMPLSIDIGKLCMTLKEVLEKADHKKKADILQALLKNITVNGKQLTILGIIPLEAGSLLVLHPNLYHCRTTR